MHVVLEVVMILVSRKTEDLLINSLCCRCSVLSCVRQSWESFWGPGEDKNISVMSFDYASLFQCRIQIWQRCPCPKKRSMALLSQETGDWRSWHFNQWACMIKKTNKDTGKLSYALSHACTHPIIGPTHTLYTHSWRTVHAERATVAQSIRHKPHTFNEPRTRGWVGSSAGKQFAVSQTNFLKEWASSLCSWEDQWFVFPQTFVRGHIREGIKLIFF